MFCKNYYKQEAVLLFSASVSKNISGAVSETVAKLFPCMQCKNTTALNGTQQNK